jgi:hypothetical protein
VRTTRIVRKTIRRVKATSFVGRTESRQQGRINSPQSNREVVEADSRRLDHVLPRSEASPRQLNSTISVEGCVKLVAGAVKGAIAVQQVAVAVAAALQDVWCIDVISKSPSQPEQSGVR